MQTSTNTRNTETPVSHELKPCGCAKDHRTVYDSKMPVSALMLLSASLFSNEELHYLLTKSTPPRNWTAYDYASRTQSRCPHGKFVCRGSILPPRAEIFRQPEHSLGTLAPIRTRAPQLQLQEQAKYTLQNKGLSHVPLHDQMRASAME